MQWHSRAVVLVVLMTGCTLPPRGAHDERRAMAFPVSTVAAGGDPGLLTISLGQPIGTEHSSEDQLFTATVVEELRASDGRLIVPRGATVHGRVARVEREKTPLLVLDLLTVETTAGPASIAAALEGARPVHLIDDEETADPDVYDPATSRYDAVLSPWSMPGPIGYAAPGAGVRYEDYYDEHANVIHLPAGARLRFRLREPLVPLLRRP